MPNFKCHVCHKTIEQIGTREQVDENAKEIYGYNRQDKPDQFVSVCTSCLTINPFWWLWRKIKYFFNF